MLLLFTAACKDNSPGNRGNLTPRVGEHMKMVHFNLPSAAENTMVDSKQFEGKVLVVTFFATWCPPCRDSIPHLSQSYKRYAAQGLEVIGVSLDTNFEDLKSYVADKKIPYTVVVGNQQTKLDYAVSSIPRMFIVDREGIIRADYLGFSTSIGAEMDEKIEALLAQ